MQSTRAERWLPIPGYEGHYEVSDQGRVRSLTRILPHPVNGWKTYRGRFLAASLSNGYPRVGLVSDGKTRNRYVHELVLTTFVRPREDDEVVCHYNDVRTDNRLANLRWGSREDNMADMIRNSGHYLAVKTHCKWGHEFTEDNTLVRSDGNRACRTCAQRRMHEFKQRRSGVMP